MTDLDVEDLLRLIRILGVGPVRDVGLLESAAARPRASAFGMVVYPHVEQRAAALLHSIARTHPLVDGNERLAWLAALVVLDLNGCECTLSPSQAFDLVMGVASGELDEVIDIAKRLRVSAR